MPRPANLLSRASQLGGARKTVIASGMAADFLIESARQTGDHGFDATPIRYRRLGPGHGAHSREILAEAAFDPARIAALVAAGVVKA